MTFTKIKITDFNAKACGTGTVEDKTVSVPFVLPGEQVEGELYASKGNAWLNPETIHHTSPDRIDSKCVHYGSCGGCSLQHVSANFYKNFKKGLVEDALKKNGLSVAVQDPVIVGERQRRRIDFKATKKDGRVTMGFTIKNRWKTIDFKECLIVVPEIEALFDPLRALINQITEDYRIVHVFITAAANGLDMILAGFKNPLTDSQMDLVNQFTKEHLVRMTLKIKGQPATVIQSEDPYVLLAGNKVPISANCFLQASAKADQILADLVTSHLPKNAHKVVDLFCGRGTLTLPIAEKGCKVMGFEGDVRSIAALTSVGHPNVRALTQDLFGDPVQVEDLKKYDAIVMNPPRSGAQSQAKQVAMARVPRVIYISCSPESFAKEAAVLCDKGYTLDKVIPVDQFMWAAHTEVVGVFRFS